MHAHEGRDVEGEKEVDEDDRHYTTKEFDGGSKDNRDANYMNPLVDRVVVVSSVKSKRFLKIEVP